MKVTMQIELDVKLLDCEGNEMPDPAPGDRQEKDILDDTRGAIIQSLEDIADTFITTITVDEVKRPERKYKT